MFRPEVAFIVTTTDCNRRADCGYCFYNVQPDRAVAARLTREAIEDLLAKLRLSGILGVYLTGGEPLMFDGLPALIARASAMSIDTMLLTNGTLLTGETVAALDKAGLRACILSLPASAAHDTRALTLAAGFQRTKMSLICVVTRKNYSRVPEVWREAQALGCGVFFQPAFIPEGHPLEAELSLKNLNAFDWPYLYSALKPWARETGNEAYLELFYGFYNGRKTKITQCHVAGRAVVIDADGEVYPCFHRRDMRCGNVLDDELTGILNRLGKFARELQAGECFGEHCISLQTSVG